MHYKIILLIFILFCNNIFPDNLNNSNKSKLDLGMCNTPVRNQLDYNTCGTFAVSAAVNAILNNITNLNNYTISEQCLLSLGSYLEQERSGWHGILINTVLDRINTTGIVEQNICPIEYPNTSHILSLEQYTNYSNHYSTYGSDIIKNKLNWRYIFDNNNDDDIRNKNRVFLVKQALDKNHRVIINAVLIPAIPRGLSINISKTNTELTKMLADGLFDIHDNYTSDNYIQDYLNNKLTTHAMVIIGYDDDAQLFKLRNSWGTNHGDNGDSYMSYRYINNSLFIEYAIEVFIN